jgi:hypothetical protein
MVWRYLIYALRHPLLAFLDSALDGNASMTVPAFIAKWHGNDGRVRLLLGSAASRHGLSGSLRIDSSPVVFSR